MDQFLIAETDFPPLQKVHRRGPLSLLFNEYGRLLPRGQGDCDVKLTTHLHILPRLEVGAATTPPATHPYAFSLHRNKFAFTSRNY